MYILICTDSLLPMFTKSLQQNFPIAWCHINFMFDTDCQTKSVMISILTNNIQSYNITLL